MLKSVNTILKQDKDKFSVPRSVRDTIPVLRMWPDGIFQVGPNKYSKTWKFTDINYQVASEEDKENMFLLYSDVLNSFDSAATTKITVNNHRLNKKDFEKSILMPLKEDGLDLYREEYNNMLLEKATGANGIMQEKYITVSIYKKSVEDARTYFARTGADLQMRLKSLGSDLEELDAVGKLRILHDFYRQGDETSFVFDVSKKAKLGHDFRDYICPDSVERNSDYIKLGEKYVRVLFLKDYGNYISDDTIAALTDMNRNLMLSIDVLSVPTDEAIREVENKLLGVETNITNWQRKQNQNNNFSAVIPYDMELQRNKTKEFLSDLTTRDQRMMLCLITMVICADSKEQLDLDTDELQANAKGRHCQMAVLKWQQMDGLNTVLPFGVRNIECFRTLNTESLAVFLPFKTQEIMDKGGIYYGENAISHNLIMCNKENLLNQSAFILGVPGSGKSFSAKELITFLMLNTDDDILICDPEGEYANLVEAMGPKLGSVIRVSAGGRDRLNAMYMVDGYGENDPIVVKSQFIMSLIEQIDKKGVGPQQKSIIDRCAKEVYEEAERVKSSGGAVPTLCTFREKLLEQPEPEAKQIALSLELFTTGSLNIFGRDSNVDMDKRVVVFDIHGLGSQLKPTGLLVITDTMLNRVTLNWKKGKRTHVFIDEFHVVFENEFSAQFFNSAWRQFRKRNAYPTAITQNVEYLLDSVQASTMLSNSEFIVMLNQAASDRDKLAKLLNISEIQMRYITNAPAGTGLIKYGSSLVPFINRFNKDTKLYALMTTRPGEGRFASGTKVY
ncbi:MAG: ATP-binding protein [Saccharofermentans sp.]|nr:ATP-binding protein [Saccharofermentans sp.]